MIDIEKLLQRRRVPVERWLEDTNIRTVEQFLVWKETNASEYECSTQFVDLVEVLLGSPEQLLPQPEVILANTNKPVEDVLPSHPEAQNAEEPKRPRRGRRPSGSGVSSTEEFSHEPDTSSFTNIETTEEKEEV